MRYIDVFRTAVSKERERQLDKWGQQSHDAPIWFAILSEEVGEVAKAILENNADECMDELVQIVAVIETWVESLEQEPSDAV